MTSSSLQAPNGLAIIGTYEILHGHANIAEATRNPDGTFDIEYEGGTDIYWNDQKTVRNANGERLFIDEDFVDWPESELVLVEDEE